MVYFLRKNSIIYVIIIVMKKSNFGENYGLFLKERRTILGISQGEVANKLHYTTQAVSKCENNKSQIDLSILGSICKIYELDLTSFINQENRKSNDYCEKYSFEIAKFANTLKFHREKHSYSQVTFCEKFGIDINKLSRWENAKSLPTLSEFIRIAKFYKVHYEDLYFGITQKKNIEKVTIVPFLPYILPLCLVLLFSVSLSLFKWMNYEPNLSNANYYHNEVEYTVNSDDSSISITKININSRYFKIPKEINDHTVNSISTNVLKDNQYIEELEISAILKNIDDYAFAYSSHLQKVILEKANVDTMVGKDIFYGDTNLNFVMTGNVTSKESGNLLNYEEYGINSSTSFTLEFNNQTTYLPDNYVKDIDLTINKLSLPTTMATIEGNYFTNCERLEEVLFSEGLTTLNANNFSHLTMNALIFPKSLKEVYGDFGTHLFNTVQISSDDFFVFTFNIMTKVLDSSSPNVVYLKNNNNVYIDEKAYLCGDFETAIGSNKEIKNDTFLYSNKNNIEINFRKTKILPKYFEDRPKWVQSLGNIKINYI